MYRLRATHARLLTALEPGEICFHPLILGIELERPLPGGPCPLFVPRCRVDDTQINPCIGKGRIPPEDGLISLDRLPGLAGPERKIPEDHLQ